MNTLLKGLIVTLASIFGFALIAAGVNVALSSADGDDIVKRDIAVAKRDDDAGSLDLVTDDDGDDGDDGDGGQTRTRTRTGHGAGAQARAAAGDMNDDLADDNGQTRTRTRTGHGAGAARAQAADDDLGDDAGQTRTRTRTGHHRDVAGVDDSSGPGSGDDNTREFSRDLTNTNTNTNTN